MIISVCNGKIDIKIGPLFKWTNHTKNSSDMTQLFVYCIRGVKSAPRTLLLLSALEFVSEFFPFISRVFATAKLDFAGSL